MIEYIKQFAKSHSTSKRVWIAGIGLVVIIYILFNTL